MATRLNPYLGFRDDAKQAMEFYHSVFGGDLTVSTFAEMHQRRSGRAGQGDAQPAPNGLTLMAADTPNSMDYSQGDNISVSLSGEDKAEITGYWEKLSDGATVTAPLEKAPWGDTFGMCKDKFGVNWLVNIAGRPG